MASVLILSVGACTGESLNSPAPRPSPTQSFACSNQQDAVEDDGFRVGETVEGDVDGDANPDAVSIHLDESGDSGCEAFLVVETETAPLSIPIWSMGAVAGFPEPSIRSVLQIDGNDGSEVVVNEARGASTQFVAVYGFSEGRLVWLRLPGGEAGLFPYGGSVGHLEAVDCTDDGQIVVTSAVPGEGTQATEEGLYDVSRSFYESEGSRLTKVSAERDSIPIDRLNRFPEFESSPFGSCISN